MSDDEFLMDDAADEDYDFDYEEDDDEDDVDADIENMYYQAKGKKASDIEGAMADLEKVVEKETQKGDWGFKALKQMTKINFRRGRHADSLRSYEQLLTYTKSAVTRNYSEKSINGILDYVSADTQGMGAAALSVADPAAAAAASSNNISSSPSKAAGPSSSLSPSQSIDLATMERFYEVTKLALEESKNERLSVKTDLKLARLWLARKEYSRLSKIIKDLRSYCTTAEGSDDQSKGTILLEIFALEIQMYGEVGDYKRLKETYDATLQVKSAIPHPRIMGVIRECGGKMHMSEKNWEAAQIDFFQAFLNYDEAGSPQRIQILKYLVLAHMLMDSEINPFDSQETKPYKNDPQIVAMTDLVGAYQRREVQEAERILAENQSTIMDDPFIRTYIDDVLMGLRTQYLIDLIQSYSRIELSFLSRHLNIPVAAVEDLLMTLILDDKIPNGRIDQVKQRLELDRGAKTGGTIQEKRYAALSRWSREIASLGDTVEEKHGNSSVSSGVMGGLSRTGITGLTLGA